MKEFAGGNDRNALNEEMEKIKNWNFQAQKMDDIKAPSKFRRYLSYFARGVGNLLGLALQVITLGHFWRAKSKVRSWFKDEDSWQQEKDHQAIPGWGGAKFDPNATSGKEILADFRRVPTVWSHLTAAKAAETVEKDGEKVEKPLDPVVSVLVDQPVSKTTQTMEGREMGHVMIGIEYSRKSIVSNRYERYKLQYGFYPVKDMLSKLSTISTGLKDSAVVPGMLVDDFGHNYDVSRRYPAKTAQVNAIIQASEKYAEGGYSVFDRNCATFVKEMVVNTAHLATGGDIFRKSEVTFSHLANLGIPGSAAFDQNIKAGTETALMDLTGEDAETYENYGNRKVTKRDWTNYKESMGKSSTWKKETYVPAEIAEHMRRMEGEGTGEIGTKKYAAPLKNNAGNTILGLDRINKSISSTADSFLSNHYDLLSPEEEQKMPYELLKIKSELSVFGQPLGDLEDKIKENLDKENEKKTDENKLERAKIKEQYYVTPQDLRDAREKLSENVSRVHIFLNYYLKNDKRAHHELMNLISLLNYGIDYVDDLYVKSVRAGKLENNDFTDVRDALTLEKYTVKASPEPEAEKADFSPTHYESYIQIYKDPKTAIQKYNRLQFLRKKKKQRGKWTDSIILSQVQRLQSAFKLEDEEDLTYDEAVELARLERMEELALQFDNAHNYMLEKEQYSQQDIDYAFRMNYMEKNGTEKKAPVRKSLDREDFRDNYQSASGIYITLILDKLFYGLKEKVLNGPEQGGLSMETVQNYQALNKWIDGFLVDRVKPKKKEFRMILRGLYRAVKAGEPGKVTSEKMRERLSDIFTKILVNRNFRSVSAPEKELFANMNLSNYTYTLGQNNEYEFSKLLNHMITECLNEDRKKPMDTMVFDD